MSFSGGGAALVFSKHLVGLEGRILCRETNRAHFWSKSCATSGLQFDGTESSFLEKISANLVSSAGGLVSQCFQSGCRDTTTAFGLKT